MRNRVVPRSTALKTVVDVGMVVSLALFGSASATAASTASGGAVSGTPLVARPTATAVPEATTIPTRGEFDCNGFSPVETPARGALCADVRGILGVDNDNTWDGRFFDNGT